MNFDWDSQKAEVNVREHGVSFDEAATVFLDPMAVSGLDPEHSVGEDRYITFGYSRLGRLLAVCYTYRPGAIQVIRRAAKGASMKSVKEEILSEYKRSDFAKLERGKFYAEVVKGASVALLDPAVAKAFPTSEEVNEALLGLLQLAQKTARTTHRSSGRSNPRRRIRHYASGTLRFRSSNLSETISTAPNERQG
jgi:uncharacterized DUF497 family protein